MGRRGGFGSSKFAIPQMFEVKLRSNGDRIRSDGKKVEGGKTFSRHFEANSYEHAAKRGEKYGKVVSVRKIQPNDIIGSIESMNLRNVVGVGNRVGDKKGGNGKRDVILDGVTLDEIVFGNHRK